MAYMKTQPHNQMFRGEYKPDNNFTFVDALIPPLLIYNKIAFAKDYKHTARQMTQTIVGSGKINASLGGLAAYLAFRTNDTYDNITYLFSSTLFNAAARSIKHMYPAIPALKGFGLGSFALIGLNHDLSRTLYDEYPHDYITDIVVGVGLVAINRFKFIQFNHKYYINAGLAYIGLLSMMTGITEGIFKYRGTNPSTRDLSYEYIYQSNTSNIHIRGGTGKPTGTAHE